MKYFHEAGSRWHYDHRFFKRELDADRQHQILVLLLEELLKIGVASGAKVILMHGGLLGWFWNKRLLPWDDDIDVSLLYADLERLDDSEPALDYDRDAYLFDVNPHFRIRETENSHFHENREPNKIDARFIDKEFGSFVDITALSPYGDSYLRTKCPHVYRTDLITPLKVDRFEGLDLYVPNRPEEVLAQEYGEGSVSNPIYHRYRFNYGTELWEATA